MQLHFMDFGDVNCYSLFVDLRMLVFYVLKPSTFSPEQKHLCLRRMQLALHSGTIVGHGASLIPLLLLVNRVKPVFAEVSNH